MAQEIVHKKLGQFASTAIAGNDILSSCLYVSGIAILFAGVFAPLVFLLIALVLFLYRFVYTEVVEALPLNGGAYNCLLNATNKPLAAIAGVMTVLSYVATCVISAKTASEYFHVLFAIPVIPVTAGIIIFFAVLTMLGVKDSSKVARTIFIFHIATLLLFSALGIYAIFHYGLGFLPLNLHLTIKNFQRQGAGKLLFFAFAASLLGVSGFESSANFVEEQEQGVFRKTLRNMTVGVLIFNPLLTFIVLQSLHLNTIIGVKDFVLAQSAFALGGIGLRLIVVIDAFFVLSGAVLAGFVGSNGLLYRMTLDHCLPSTVLLPRLRTRNANTNRIILGFAVLCISILALTRGNLLSLAGVYTISFLGVMSLFAIGNIILRNNRPDLKRPYKGILAYSIFAALATIGGIIGNILIDQRNLLFFLIYFIPAVLIVITMIYRDLILEFVLKLCKPIPRLYNAVKPWFEHVTRPRILVFVHHPHKLFHALRYVQKNETSRNIAIVFCNDKSEQSSQLLEKIRKYTELFKEAAVFPHINIELEVEESLPFGPEVVKEYASRFRINRNNIFIGSIHESHAFTFDQLGGVRIIQ